MIQKSIQIKLETGLEARPVAMLVSKGPESGAEVMVTADGADEETAVAEIEKFLTTR